MRRDPLICAIAMGYGHLRPAHALADVLGGEVLEVDKPPLAGPSEQKLWERTRTLYEGFTRWSQHPTWGAPLRPLLAGITAIPHLYPVRDLSPPTTGMQLLKWLAGRGLGRGLVEALAQDGGRPLLTTFFAPAVLADHAGLDGVHCVVTDSDVNRIWAPFEPKKTRITYLAPSWRVVQRLRAYGVPEERVEYTGFPLPHALLGGDGLPVARANLAARIVRLDPGKRFRKDYGGELDRLLEAPLPSGEEGAPPRLTFAVGGAGAQADLAQRFLPSVAPLVRAGRLRLALIAGVRAEVRDLLAAAVARAGLEQGAVEILWEPELGAYFGKMNELLGRTDVLWTKPSEMAFFAGLGLPMIFSPPVGVHERYNRRWVLEVGGGIVQREPTHAGEWLSELVDAGTLAAAAWAGFMRLPKRGLYRIAQRFRPELAQTSRAAG